MTLAYLVSTEFSTERVGSWQPAGKENLEIHCNLRVKRKNISSGQFAVPGHDRHCVSLAVERRDRQAA
jgi:hypothetical protein